MIRLTYGKFFFVAALAVVFPNPGIAQDMTAEEVVAMCAAAMGGSSNIEAIETITFQAFSWSRGPDSPTYWEIVRPGTFRFEQEGKFVALFDGQRFGFLEGPPKEDGTLQGPHLLPAEDTWTFEMDPSPHIPGFFDLPTEYLGLTEAEGIRSHLLRVEYPLGGVAVYSINAESFLPIGIEYPDLDFRAELGDFREVGGMLFAHSVTNAANPERVTTFREFEVNVDLDPARFVFPADVR